MKSLLTYISLTACLLSFAACDKDIEETNSNLPTLNPASIDADAKDWKPFVATSTADFPLPAPEAVTSQAYQKELQDLKTKSSGLTAEQKKAIDYWKVGGTVRWNEIMRELVAKHNIPPYQNADGTYPVPSAANPFSYPEFPFSNPPYAARAYAYVSVAQYDALIMAWNFKSQFNRPAPYKVDNSIPVAIPKSDLPSYPSEDAVLSGASFEMMKLLFPADIAYITKKAEEEKNYRIWSGANVAGDIAAGDSLGRWVARKVIARAKADGMGTAGGNAALFKKLADDCIARGETPWISLETPKRPPMLAAYGNLKPLLFAPGVVANLRSVPPPGTGSKEMRAQLDELIKFTNNPTREQIRLVNFWADGAGTYTPPGHWNLIATEEFVKKQYSEIRFARNYALLNAAMMDAAIVCWNTKYFYFTPRPIQLDSRIKTLTGMPNFPAYISGHSTFSGAAAEILGYLLPDKKALYERMATDASNSRMYGGIHYRADCVEGLKAGKAIGRYAVERARVDNRE